MIKAKINKHWEDILDDLLEQGKFIGSKEPEYRGYKQKQVIKILVFSTPALLLERGTISSGVFALPMTLVISDYFHSMLQSTMVDEAAIQKILSTVSKKNHSGYESSSDEALYQ